MAEPVKSAPAGGGFRFKVRGPRDFYGGLVLMAIAMFAIWAAGDLPGQDGFAFGPGTAPRMFAGLLAAVGGLVSLTGLLADGPKIDTFAVRGPAYVVAAILTFAAMVRGVSLELFGLPLFLPPFGLVLSTFFAFMISILGSSEFRWTESLLVAAAMTAFCVVVFAYLLHLPFQLWPMF
ncbi:MAG: tripartite tricarboxylate transporter TctB family protein [Pseudolabrys sp.]|nr:tripartite tricarboxylate transporter TctB family protein [Pseudolabrys sp.]